MFICGRCNTEKIDNERGSIGWVAKVGLLVLVLIPGFIWLPRAWSKTLCKDCCWGYRSLGAGCLILLGMAMMIGLIVKYTPH